MGVGKNITLAALDQFSHRLSTLDEAEELRAINAAIARLRVKTSSPELPIGRLSGGNQQKAILAKCLLLNPKILILDERRAALMLGRARIYVLINALVKQGISVDCDFV
ncbi:ATP-binding cassette domain-containing protein [Pantoea ananatis]